MRALVTGGAGFIGSRLVAALLERGHQPRVLDNMITGDPARVPAQAELLELDLRDLDSVRAACRDVDVVFHVGALRSVPKSVDDPVLATECNVIGTMNVLVASAEASVERVVYSSSSSVYGQNAADVQREDQRPDPFSPYAASKLAGEHYCRVWSQLHALPTISLRYFNVFGPGQRADSKYAAVFPAFVSSLKARRAPVVHWDGEQSRDFTYVQDVVDANLAALDVDRSRLLDVGGPVVNIGGGSPKSVNEVLRAVSDVLGIWIEPARVARRSGDVRSTCADIRRARELLGWHPRVEWSEAVRRTVEWFD